MGMVRNGVVAVGAVAALVAAQGTPEAKQDARDFVAGAAGFVVTGAQAVAGGFVDVINGDAFGGDNDAPRQQRDSDPT